MVGENIQKFRDQFQATRSQFMGGLPISEKIQSMRILKGNPSPNILSNLQIGKRLQETVQTFRGKTTPAPSGGRKTTSGVFMENSVIASGRKVVSV